MEKFKGYVHQLLLISKLQIVHKWILMKKPVMSTQSSCFIYWQKSCFFFLYFASFCQTGLTSLWMKRPLTENKNTKYAIHQCTAFYHNYFVRLVHSVACSAKLRHFDSSLYFSLYLIKRIDPSLRRSIKLDCSFIKIIRIYLVTTEPWRCATGPLHRISSVWDGFSSVRVDSGLVDDDRKLCYAKVKRKAP